MSEHGHTHSHFDDAAATWDDDPAKVERARATAALLRGALGLDGTERVLEIGGGTGQLSLALADAVASVVITDASTGMVDVARANIERAGLADRLTAERLDLLADSAPEGTFDGVWSQLAMHHVHELDALLTRVRALLAPGGWLAVIELDDDRAHAFHASHTDFDGHHGFDRESFADRLRANGFRDVTVRDAGSVEKELGGDDQGRGTFGMFLAIAHA
ncbi:class I SAM-dependent methyltransferase [Knoellia subterranea]|uniref:Methyltransferase n=1 Tax=Knoellia subterranea KCTC 19937 TaxID=1385521 RepID=A0A0A0JLG3_9MICO|nr:class I SAM-dependent methyltransferase [Knoellia subterranea]KGN38295.1 methyltransferase [Knoellia subterranea KCTC 19937]